MSRPMCAHWRAPDDYCEAEVAHDGDYCSEHDPDWTEPDADFTRDGMREECA